MTSSVPDRDRMSSGWSPRARRHRRAIPLRLVSFVLLVPLLTGLFAAPAATRVSADELTDAQAAKKALQKKIEAQKNDVAELEKMQDGLRTQIAQTSVQLNGINADLDKTRANIAKMRVQIAKVQARYDALVFQVQQLDGSIERVTQAENEKRQELATRKALLAQRIRSAYETDRTSLLETFLSGGNFTDILTEVSYYLDVGEQDKQLAEQVSKDQETLASLHETVVETRAATDELRAKTALQKVELDKDLEALQKAEAQLHDLEVATAQALAAQKNAFAAAARNKAALKLALKQSAAAQQRLEARIRKLIAEQVKRGNIPSAYNGTMEWPMGGQVTQDFGCTGVPFEPPLGSCAHFHQGIDLVSPEGTEVKAAADGVVVKCGWNYADGTDPAWLVIVAHSAVLESWYAHLQPECPVPVGSKVKQGDVLGHEGNTGHSTGPHLHWAVRQDGTFVNPRLYL